MSIRRIFVCDRCKIEALMPEERFPINYLVPLGWSKITSFLNRPGLNRPFNRTTVRHLCEGCSTLHQEWLRPEHKPGGWF